MRGPRQSEPNASRNLLRASNRAIEERAPSRARGQGVRACADTRERAQDRGSVRPVCDNRGRRLGQRLEAPSAICAHGTRQADLRSRKGKGESGTHRVRSAAHPGDLSREDDLRACFALAPPALLGCLRERARGVEERGTGFWASIPAQAQTAPPPRELRGGPLAQAF